VHARKLEPELMDDPLLAEREHRRALNGLSRLNRISRAAQTLWPSVKAMAPSGKSDQCPSLSVLDVATGSADVPLGLISLARSSIALDMRACDVSPVALAVAAERAKDAGVRLTLQQRDVLADGLAEPDASVDVVTCSLFLHHLTQEQAVRVLNEMRRVSRKRVIVSDLRRCHMGLAAAFLAGRTATRSRIVRVDSVRSVRAAFTPDELRSLAERAQMPDASIVRRWPFRMLLSWTRTPTPSAHPEP
jgi:ubiquinone/menaquinone biosynthesis C-methylase UbiE